jgi:iron complex outermembrane recepter protein
MHERGRFAGGAMTGHGMNGLHLAVFRARRTVLLIGTLVAIALPAWPQQNPPDLTDKSLEDLMNIEVTSVSKKEEKLSRTASAVFVITAEDIRRSNALNIPDLLRMVPGLDVAQINANTWAISARGFNGRFSNNLLVLLDGRNVYTPTFDGVFWDVLDLPLENIERIEVIRGPGGSVWGANAVNGVINIIQKKASETKGAMIVVGGGNVDQGFGTTQYGGSLGKSVDYRVYGKYFNQDHFEDPAGQSGGDGWHILRGGFRTDSALSSKDTLTVQGDVYTGREGDPGVFLPSVTSPGLVEVIQQVNLAAGYLQSIWNHVYSNGSDSTLQVSFDAYDRDDVLREVRKTLSADFHHHFPWGKRQDFVWGLGYRFSTSHTDGGLSVSLNPADLNTQVFSSFIQDEIALAPDRLYLTVGAKLEHDYYTGFGFWPSARMAWNLSEHHMFWAAISDAGRTPSSIDTALRLNFAGFAEPDGTPVLVGLVGNPHFKTEGLVAYEGGYRATVLRRLTIDFTAYYNNYGHQQTTEPATPFFETSPPPPHLFLPSTYENLMHGGTHGAEITANWQVTSRWTLSPGYDFERIHMHVNPASQDTTSAPELEGTDPHQQAQLRSHLDLSHGLAWDTSAYFVDRLVFFKIPSYTQLDTGLTWQCTKRISLGMVGQNLTRDGHLEFVDTTQSARSTLIKRGGYAKLTWHF